MEKKADADELTEYDCILWLSCSHSSSVEIKNIDGAFYCNHTLKQAH